MLKKKKKASLKNFTIISSDPLKVGLKTSFTTFSSLSAFKKIEIEIFRSWWVIVFILLCYYGYEHGVYQQNQDFIKLQQQYLNLKQEMINASAEHERLILQINSQSDPDWIELTLMKRLGVVPEGQTKIFFTNK